MKIPETAANVGAYYGNEENGQWQPNGVIIDSGVGGGVVGSGDAGVHRPPYPLHIPRSHIPGYVMAGAYYPAAYPAAPAQDDFADYMWMEHEEEFDKQDDFEEYMWMADEEQFDKEVMQQLEEEALMEQCIEAMLEDEQRERTRPSNGHGNSFPTTSSAGAVSLEEAVSRSTLNPLAAEFVPTRRQAPPEESPPAPAEPPAADPVTPSITADGTDEDNKQQAAEPPLDPPEVSAADVCARADRKEKRTKDKRGKPQPAKSDTKVQPKKKDVKAVKSESKVAESAPSEEPAPAPVVIEAPSKPQPPSPTEEPTGPKPINYAAAAKANKPKKPLATPPTTEKTPPPTEKPKTKTEKPIQRKNSTK